MLIDCVTCIISFTLAIKVVSFPIHVLCTLAMCTAYAYLNKPVNYKQILRTQKHLAIFFIKEYKPEKNLFKSIFLSKMVCQHI